MKTEQQLLNNIIGQLNGLKEMVEKNRDCFEVIVQMKAAKSSFNTLMNRYMERQFISCLDKCRSANSKENLCKKFFGEITAVN